MSKRITPANITKLKKNEVFVFGSNMLGNHAGGAARLAAEKFGAINGTGHGIMGSSYAIPTLNESMNRVNIPDLSIWVSAFINHAKGNAKYNFLVTEIGCGIAGFAQQEIAPLFIEAVDVDNIFLPEPFIDIISSPKKGYKVTDSDMKCRDFQFELGVVFHQEGNIVPCSRGFHYCVKLADCFGYYSFDSSNRVFEVEDYGNTVSEGDKNCTSHIKLVRELSWLEVLELVNTGSGNSGISNAGNYNSGNYNAGYSNAGNDNSGNRNAGNRNAGNDNSGNRNAGYSNAGNYNSGNRNAGYSNAGNDNSGAFNNLQANYMLFNKPSDWTYQNFIDSAAYRLLSSIDTTIWVPSSHMTEQEIKDHPYHVTTLGYVKNIPYKEAFTNAWNNWSESSRQHFKDLPNFDAEIFEDITGVKV